MFTRTKTNKQLRFTLPGTCLICTNEMFIITKH